jgi:hypothetical protein
MFMLLLLQYLPLFLRFDRGVVHVVAALSTITVYGFTEEWIMFLLVCLPFLFKFWQSSGSSCCYYVVYYYCLRFDKGVVHVALVGYSIYHYPLMFDREWFLWLFLYCLPLLFNIWQRSGSYCCYFIVYHYCLRFDRGVVHVVLVILSTITV